jgi:hypothetical protein
MFMLMFSRSYSKIFCRFLILLWMIQISFPFDLNSNPEKSSPQSKFESSATSNNNFNISSGVQAAAGQMEGCGIGLPALMAAMLFAITLTHAGWVSPSSVTAANGWTGVDNARDGNTGTYASRGAEAGWGQYIEFGLSSSIYCNSVRVYADFGYNQVDSVSVDVNNG